MRDFYDAYNARKAEEAVERAEQGARRSERLSRFVAWGAPAALYMGIVSTFGKIIPFTDPQQMWGALALSAITSAVADRVVVRNR